MTLTMDEVGMITAQEKWSGADPYMRQQMLRAVGYPMSYASFSWKKLPYLLKENLNAKTWAA